MDTYAARTNHFQNAYQARPLSVFGWIKQKLEDRRVRLAAAREIAYLRTLDRHLLEDMGVDIASLGEIKPKLAHFNPHLVACTVIGRSMMPANMSSR